MLLGISNPISSEDEGNMKIMTFVSRPYDTAWITVSQHRKRLGDELGVSLRIECEAFSIWR